MSAIINTGVVGYGLSGKVFHTPFVHASPHFNLIAIVSTGHQAAQSFPYSKVYKAFEEVIADADIDLVVLCTPHQLHAKYAMAALLAGKHVVVEKPVALSSAEVELLMKTANETGKTIFPYHNRRWDGDFITLKHIINEGFLGEVLDFESHFDRYQPKVSRAEWRYNQSEGGGTLFDLGPHLIDQALSLFGIPEAVFCQLHFQRPGSKANDGFDLRLIYPKLTATLKASVFVREPGPRFQVHGTLGSFIKYGLDTQEESLKSGITPYARNFGHEQKKMNGLLHSVAHDKSFRLRYPTFPGCYMDFYNDVFASLSGKKLPEVKVEHAWMNIKIIETAIISHFEKRIINLTV